MRIIIELDNTQAAVTEPAQGWTKIADVRYETDKPAPESAPAAQPEAAAPVTDESTYGPWFASREGKGVSGLVIKRQRFDADGNEDGYQTLDGDYQSRILAPLFTAFQGIRNAETIEDAYEVLQGIQSKLG